MSAIKSVPVIVNESLRCRNLGELFSARFSHLKIRHSASTLRGTCIFPTSSVAFLLLEAEEAKREDCFERIESFIGIHRRSFVVFRLDLNGDDLVSSILSRILPTSYYVMVVSEWTEAVDALVTAAEAHSPTALTNLKGSLTEFVEDSTSEEAVIAVLAQLGLNGQESGMLLDGCGSVAGMAAATGTDQFLEFGLDEKTACHLADFFSEDS